VLGTLHCRTVLGSGDPRDLHEPGGMDLLPDGRLLIADTNNHRLRIGDPREGRLEDLELG